MLPIVFSHLHKNPWPQKYKSQNSLISRRIAYDYMNVKHGSSLNRRTISISLLLKCKSSHAKYVQFLEEQKPVDERAEKSKKKTWNFKSLKEKN